MCDKVPIIKCVLLTTLVYTKQLQYTDALKAVWRDRGKKGWLYVCHETSLLAKQDWFVPRQVLSIYFNVIDDI